MRFFCRREVFFLRKTWTMLACVLGVLGLTWCLRTVYIINYAPARAFDSQVAPTQRPLTQTRAATPEPTLSPEKALALQADEDFMRDRVNLLIVGFDESPERDETGTSVSRNKKNNFRSDVLMLTAVNFAKDSVHLISVPRDTYAEIYNTRGRWKINAAFAKGGAATGDGFTYAMKTVELLFGVPVPYYVGVNMSGLKKLVDAIGGVDYDVDVEIRLNGRTLQKGYQHLDGQQALDYCRARKGISTDLGRNDRQQRMLLAVFAQLKRENRITAIPGLYAAVRDDVYTNLTTAQIAALAAFALRLDPETSFRRTTLAGEYVNNVYNASYYVLKNKALAALVKEEFGVSVKRSSRYDLTTVKRDKAAAEARRAAKEVEDVAAMLTLPVDATGAYRDDLLELARASADMLLTAIDTGASATEINRLRTLMMGDVGRLLRKYNITSGVPDSFKGLMPVDGGGYALDGSNGRSESTVKDSFAVTSVFERKGNAIRACRRSAVQAKRRESRRGSYGLRHSAAGLTNYT